MQNCMAPSDPRVGGQDKSPPLSRLFVYIRVNYLLTVMTYAYIRVSTDRQTLENQRFEIINYCRSENLHVDFWIQETVSGTLETTERKLGELLKQVRKGDVIICAELSRLGRSLFMIMNILNICLKKECRVWTVKERYRLGEDIQSKVLAFTFGLAAEIERQLISTRTREALARKKAEGVALGRPKGSTTVMNKLDRHRDVILLLLNSRRPVAAIARDIGCSRTTLYHWLHLRGLLYG